jgi:tRNA threonylcarbamoyladenosine biosynthesis protein TsaB
MFDETNVRQGDTSGQCKSCELKNRKGEMQDLRCRMLLNWKQKRDLPEYLLTLFSIIFAAMPKLLHIDTAGFFCSVALSEGENLLGLRETSEKNAHARVITIFIQQLLEEHKITPTNLSAVAVSMGPGSYTGLRIGVSAAKGLCYALDIPFIGMNTLQIMALGTKQVAAADILTPDSVICPMIDARRMEVYSALYDRNGNEIRETAAEILDKDSYADLLEKQPVIFSGNGSQKLKPLLVDRKNAVFLDDFNPSAKYMVDFAYQKFVLSQFENTAYCEPFYLKEFIAGAPRVKGLK